MLRLRTDRSRRATPPHKPDYDDPNAWRGVVEALEGGGYRVYVEHVDGGLIWAPDGWGWIRFTQRSALRLARRAEERRRRTLRSKARRQARLAQYMKGDR